MPVNLRHFYYLDEALVKTYAAAAEGFVSGPETVRRLERSQAMGGGGIKIPGAKLGGELASGHEQEVTGTREVPVEARYDQLSGRIEESGNFVVLEAVTPEQWGYVKRNAYVEASGRVRLSPVDSWAGAGETFGGLGAVVEAATGDSMIPAEGKKMLQALGLLQDMAGGSGVPLILELPSEADYKIVTRLNPNWLRVPVTEIPDEVTIAGKVQRLLREGETFSTFDLVDRLKKLPLPKEQRDELEELRGQMSVLVTEVGPPAAIVTPVAVFV